MAYSLKQKIWSTNQKMSSLVTKADQELRKCKDRNQMMRIDAKLKAETQNLQSTLNQLNCEMQAAQQQAGMLGQQRQVLATQVDTYNVQIAAVEKAGGDARRLKAERQQTKNTLKEVQRKYDLLIKKIG
jgi:septal ring factor EnvC (AmiA/AmiB activator)